MIEATQQLKIKFSQTFWDQSDIIFKQTQQNRTQIKQFLSLLESRSKIELKYSQQLNSLCVDKLEHKNNTSAELIKIYMLAVRKRADQAKYLSKFIMEQIIFKLKEMFQNSSDLKKDINFGREMQKQYCKIKQLVDKNKAKYLKKKKQYQEAQVLNFVMNTCQEYGIEKKSHQKEKLKQKYSQFKEISNELKKSVQQYKQTIKKYEKSMKPILGKLYDQQHTRLQKIIHIVKNMQIMESSYIQNLKYDNEQNYKFINNAKVEKQIDTLILKYSRKSKKNQKIQIQDNNNFILRTFTRIENKQFDNLLKYGKQNKLSIQQYFLGKLQQNQDNLKINKICQFFDLYWNGQVGAHNNQIEQIKSLLSDIYSRKIFLMCMQQLRITSKFQIRIKSLKIILKIINVFLDNCTMDKDSYHAKQIMILTFTYYVTQNQSKIFLYHFLKQNHIWKQTQFWQSAFLQGIYQQFQGYSKYTTDIKGTVGHFQRQQNLVFNQLAYYIHNMIFFGVSQKHAKTFTQKYIKLYNIDQGKSNQLYVIIFLNKDQHFNSHKIKICVIKQPINFINNEKIFNRLNNFSKIIHYFLNYQLLYSMQYYSNYPQDQDLLQQQVKIQQQTRYNHSSKKDYISYLYGWGKNQDGELSLGNNKNTLQPTQVKLKSYARQIASASSHSALINSKFQLYVTGSHSHDRLGLEDQVTNISKFKLQTTVLGMKVKQVACGDYHTLALLQNGTVFSWGGSLWGKKGQKIGQGRSMIQALKKQKIMEIACGDFHSVALTQKGQIYSWGGGGKDKNKGQLGHSNLKDYERPQKIMFFQGKKLKKIGCGHYHTMALSVQQELFSWGQGIYGQLGCGAKQDSHTPKRVNIKVNFNLQKQYFQTDKIKEPLKILQIALGGKHSLLLTNKGLYVCGYNSQGQLGIGQGKTQNIGQPLFVEAFLGKRIIMVAAGSNHSIALTDQNNVYTCGYNFKGQLGLNDQKSRTIWTHVGALAGKRVNRVYAGGHHSWAVVDQTNPEIQDYEYPSPLQEFDFPSRMNQITQKNDRSAVSNLTFIEQLCSSKVNLQVIYTQVDMHHRFIRFTLKQENIIVKQKMKQYINFCQQIQKGYLKYKRIQHDSDLYDANGNIITQADRKSYTIMMVCDCAGMIENNQNSRKQQNKVNVAIGQLVILKQHQLKMKGQIPVYNKWFFKFNELFDGLIQKVRFLQLRPKFA